MDNEMNMEEYVQQTYPLIYKAVEDLKDGSVKMNQIIDQFYFNIGKLVHNGEKSIVVGKFVAEMAKAICYTMEESINQDDYYFVLLFSDITEINVVSMCRVHIIDRNYFVYNTAMQFVTMFPDTRYIYKHEESCRYMLNFIDNVRNQYQYFHFPKPITIDPPIKMRLDSSKDKDLLIGIDQLNHYSSDINGKLENTDEEPDPVVHINSSYHDDNNTREGNINGNE